MIFGLVDGDAGSNLLTRFLAGVWLVTRRFCKWACRHKSARAIISRGGQLLGFFVKGGAGSNHLNQFSAGGRRLIHGVSMIQNSMRAHNFSNVLLETSLKLECVIWIS